MLLDSLVDSHTQHIQERAENLPIAPLEKVNYLGRYTTFEPSDKDKEHLTMMIVDPH